MAKLKLKKKEKVMKNLKILLIGIFAAGSLTEISYSIILTGPARRNAHRQQTQEAELKGYAVGSEYGKNHNDQEQEEQSYNNQYYSDDNVQVQSLGDDQNLGNGQFLSQIKSRLSPEQKEKIKAKMLARLDQKDQSNVTTQSIDEEQASEQKPVEEHATEQIATQEQAVEQFPEEHAAMQQPSEEHVADQHPAVEPAILEEHVAQTPQEEHLVVAEVQQQHIEPVQAHLEQAVQASSEFVQATHAAEPVVHVQPTVVEHVKIVKVYPVFDAVKAACEHVMSATNDMINYVYSFFGKSTEVQVQATYATI